MPDPRHALGLRIEIAVAEWLKSAGWQVLARRARAAGGGEVDLVAIDATGVLVAVEVRARRSARTGVAATTVDRRRIRRLRGTLASIGRDVPVPYRGMRVDLVTAEPIPGTADGWRLQRIPGIDAA